MTSLEHSDLVAFLHTLSDEKLTAFLTQQLTGSESMVLSLLCARRKADKLRREAAALEAQWTQSLADDIASEWTWAEVKKARG